MAELHFHITRFFCTAYYTWSIMSSNCEVLVPAGTWLDSCPACLIPVGLAYAGQAVERPLDGGLSKLGVGVGRSQLPLSTECLSHTHTHTLCPHLDCLYVVCMYVYLLIRNNKAKFFSSQWVIFLVLCYHLTLIKHFHLVSHKYITHTITLHQNLQSSHVISIQSLKQHGWRINVVWDIFTTKTTHCVTVSWLFKQLNWLKDFFYIYLLPNFFVYLQKFEPR